MLPHKLPSILLVDDDLDECNLFKEALQELDIQNELLCFHTVKDFLAFINNEDLVPAIAFIDLHIPILNGIEIIGKVREKPIFKETPIALYSNSSSEKDMKNAHDAGASFYIQKPNTFDKLKDMIEEALPKQFRS